MSHTPGHGWSSPAKPEAIPTDPRPPVDIEITGAVEAGRDAEPTWRPGEPVWGAGEELSHDDGPLRRDAAALWQSDEPTDTRPSGSPRRRRIVLGAALAVGLLGAAGIGTVGWRVAQQSDATLTTPDQVAGLVRDDSERARQTAEYLRTGFAAGIDLDQSIGAVYNDPAAADRSVLLFGGTALLWQPSQDLDRLFDLVADDGQAVEGLRQLPAGELGGVLKCGSTPTDEGDLTVCGWADHGSAVLAMFPGRQVEESAQLLREIRSGIQSRN